jgi:phosphate transport system substrate-binding protein
VSGTIKAAGSTFQTNFQQGAISAFKSVDPNATVDYDPVGSGTGRADLYANTVLFAGSDSAIPAKEASKVPAGKTVLYFPVQIGPIAMAYNLPSVTGLSWTRRSSPGSSRAPSRPGTTRRSRPSTRA